MVKIRKRKLRKRAKILFSIIFLCISLLVVIIFMVTLDKGEPEKPIVNVNKPSKEVKKPVDNAKKGSIDVLAVGGSDLYSALTPLQLWNDTGITSYVASERKQNMCVSYYMVDEIFKYQKPKVLILEMDNFFETRGEDNKETALKTVYQTCYPLFKETPLWNQLKDEPYTKRENANMRTLIKGYFYKTDVEPNTEGYDYMGSHWGEEPIVSYTEKYLPMIMDIASKNNCKVIFICMPSKTSWTYKKHNTVAKYAEEYNVPFLDMNISDYDSGFDWLTDTRDAGNHLNHNGAMKVTKFLGNYLKENYDLIDHRGNPNFADWDEDYEYYLSLTKK